MTRSWNLSDAIIGIRESAVACTFRLFSSNGILYFSLAHGQKDRSHFPASLGAPFSPLSKFWWMDVGSRQKWYVQSLIYAFRGFTFHPPGGCRGSVVMINIPGHAGRRVKQQCCNNKAAYVTPCQPIISPARLAPMTAILREATQLRVSRPLLFGVSVSSPGVTRRPALPRTEGISRKWNCSVMIWANGHKLGPYTLTYDYL